MATVILTSHGTDDAVGATLIRGLVAAVAEALPEHRVLEAFVDVQEPSLEQVLGSELAENLSGQVLVVPLLLGTGYHVRKDMADAIRSAVDEYPSADIRLSPALNNEPEVLQLLVRRVLEVCAEPSANDLIVLATAGSSDAEAVERVKELHQDFALLLAEVAPKAQSELGFLSAADPRLKDLVPKLKFKNPRKNVVVATHLLAPGFFFGLANKAGAHSVAQPLLASNEPAAAELVALVVRRVRSLAEPSNALGCPKPLDSNWSCSAGCVSVCR
jgi:sirohydrochlorin ferrochelatase